MQTIFDTCTPRDEVRHGALSEDMFAARLRDVMDGKAGDVYQNPDRFFANTYPTHNLIALYHAATGHVPPAVRQRFGLGALRLPDPGEVAVAGVVGSDLDPSNGMAHPTGGVPTATGEGTLADQTVAFLMTVMEFVASKQRVVLVLTMASDRDAFGYDRGPARLTTVVTLGGDALRAIADQVIAALRQAGYKPTDLGPSRKAPFYLQRLSACGWAW